jgi:hypothetical protein
MFSIEVVKERRYCCITGTISLNVLTRLGDLEQINYL